MNPQPRGNASPQATDLARLESIFALQREAYARSPMPSLAERKRNLAALRALLIDHTDAIAEAISADFTARSVDDTLLGEIIPSVPNSPPRTVSPSPALMSAAITYAYTRYSAAVGVPTVKT
jgi:hypothetical protein